MDERFRPLQPFADDDDDDDGPLGFARPKDHPWVCSIVRNQFRSPHCSCSGSCSFEGTSQEGSRRWTTTHDEVNRFSAYQIFHDSGRTSLTEDFVRIAQLIAETIQIFLRIFSNDVLILKMTFDFGVNRFIAIGATRIASCTRPKTDDLRNNHVLRLWMIFACLLHTFDDHFSLLIHYFIG